MQHWYPFYWADYSSKTMHLTQGEHGAYFMLLRYIYTTGNPIPYKQRYSIARALLEHEQENVDAVLSEFFDLEGDFYVSDKAMKVIKEQQNKHDARVTAGKLGGISKASNARILPVAKLKQSSSNQNQNKKEKETNVSKNGFDGFWKVYPRKIGKDAATKAYASALNRATAEQILAGAIAYAESQKGKDPQYTAHPTTWLNAGRWADEHKPVDPAKPAPYVHIPRSAS